jgi:hypothetical protein
VDGWVWSNGGLILTGETEVLGEKHYTVWVVDGWMSMEQWWNGTDRGNWSTGRKTCPNATLFTINLKTVSWNRTRTSAVRCRRLTACTISLPHFSVSIFSTTVPVTSYLIVNTLLLHSSSQEVKSCRKVNPFTAPTIPSGQHAMSQWCSSQHCAVTARCLSHSRTF